MFDSPSEEDTRKFAFGISTFIMINIFFSAIGIVTFFDWLGKFLREHWH